MIYIVEDRKLYNFAPLLFEFSMSCVEFLIIVAAAARRM